MCVCGVCTYNKIMCVVYVHICVWCVCVRACTCEREKRTEESATEDDRICALCRWCSHILYTPIPGFSTPSHVVIDFITSYFL